MAIIGNEKTVEYLNCYYCEDCDMTWYDEWTCICNDRCPVCRSEIEPLASVELETNKEEK